MGQFTMTGLFRFTSEAGPAQQPFQDVATAQSPYHYWKLDDPAGTDSFAGENYNNPAVDAMGNGDLYYFPFNQGSNTTSLRADGVGSAFLVNSGRAIEALQNNGSTYLNDRAQLQGSDFSLVFGYRHFTWLNSPEYFMGMYNDGNFELEYGFIRNFVNNSLEFVIEESGGTRRVEELIADLDTPVSGITLNDGGIHLVGLSFDYTGGTMTLYVDDQTIATVNITTWSGTWLSQTPQADSYFTPSGSISYANAGITVDEVLMYQRAITQQEMLDLHTAFVWNGV